MNDHFELMRDALRYGQGRLRLADVQAAFSERVAQKETEFVPVLHHRAGAPGARYTTARAKRIESGKHRASCSRAKARRSRSLAR